MTKTQVATRVDPDFLKEIDAAAAYLSQQAKGAPVSRSEFVTVALRNFVDSLKREQQEAQDAD